MKKAKAMYIPAGGKKAVWGPVDHNVLPEGYPYKEQSETVVLDEQAVVTETFGDHAIGDIVSNETELLAGETYEVFFNGEKYICVAKAVEAFDNMVTVGNVGLSEHYVTTAGFEDTGEPFCFVDGNVWTLGTKTAGTYTISAKRISETIHPMAPEFLPAGVGGGAFVVKYRDDGSLDKTLEEIGAAIDAGMITVIQSERAGLLFTAYQYEYSRSDAGKVINVSWSCLKPFDGKVIDIQLDYTGELHVAEYSLSLTVPK